MRNPGHLRAINLVELLALRHAQDVFVSECKSGPTQSANHVRLDGWAMKKSWANPLTIGYEVKVSRQDFLGDVKWSAYLPLCNQFFFVAPPGIIDPKEIPEQAGLLISSANGTILFQKVKAPYRNVQIPESLFRYVLYCRARIQDEYQEPLKKRDFWKKWLEEKKLDQQFGWRVRGAIGKRVEEEIENVGRENKRLTAQMEKYDGFKKTLIAHGIDPDIGEWRFENKVRELLEGVPQSLEENLEKLGSYISLVRNNLQAMRGKAVEVES